MTRLTIPGIKKLSYKGLSHTADLGKGRRSVSELRRERGPPVTGARYEGTGEAAWEHDAHSSVLTCNAKREGR